MLRFKHSTEARPPTATPAAVPERQRLRLTLQQDLHLVLGNLAMCDQGVGKLLGVAKQLGGAELRIPKP